MAEAGKRFAGQLDPRLRGRRTHACVCCDFPIAVYGRCAPCLHAFCLTCAAGMAQCIICGASITKLERIPGQAGLYISPLTLQAYRSEADLARHAQQLAAQLATLLPAGGAAGGAAAAGQAAAPKQQLQAGWKPPPPPLPQGGAPGAGFARQQQQRQNGLGRQQQQYNHQQQPGAGTTGRQPT